MSLPAKRKALDALTDTESECSVPADAVAEPPPAADTISVAPSVDDTFAKVVLGDWSLRGLVVSV